MIVSARCSFRWSRRFSASSCFMRGSTGRGPRRCPRISRSAPASRCRRQFVSSDEYNPSRRNRAPTSPGCLHASACLRMRNRYSAEKRRRWTVAGTSGSGSDGRDVVTGPGPPAALRAPSAPGPATTSISTASGMRIISPTLPAPTLISPGRLSHRLLAQGGVGGLIHLSHAPLANEGGQGHELFRLRSRSFYAQAVGEFIACAELPLGGARTLAPGPQEPRWRSGSLWRIERGRSRLNASGGATCCTRSTGRPQRRTVRLALVSSDSLNDPHHSA